MGNAVDAGQHWYNIGFTLGDPWADGHGGYETYHMKSNYAPDVIKAAYIKASKLLGFDFIKECCAECDAYYIEPGYAKILADKGIINKKYLNKNPEWIPVGAYSLCEGEKATDEFVDVFIDIIKLVKPDFILEKRNLQEEDLDILNGAGYGITDKH